MSGHIIIVSFLRIRKAQSCQQNYYGGDISSWKKKCFTHEILFSKGIATGFPRKNTIINRKVLERGGVTPNVR
jgi:hypothetical protein